MLKKRCLMVLKNISERAAKRANGTASEFAAYQPKMPECLLKQKEKK